MSDKSESPKKIWLEYSPDEQHLYLTDELMWTGYLTEYVRADIHNELYEALEKTVSDGEQCYFEDWLASECPSGDCESVDRQWRESSNYSDFTDEWGAALSALDKARGE